MSVTANQLIVESGDDRRNIPAAASTRLYQGTLAFINSDGYCDDDTAAGVNEFAGIVVSDVDNSGGSAGDLDVELKARGQFVLQGTGFTQATVGQQIFGVDNFTVSTTGTGNSHLGLCVGYISSTKILVDLKKGVDPDAHTVASVGDDEELYVGDGSDAGLQWATADADNHAAVLFLGDSNQALHITDKGARDSDWAIGAGTHPTVYIHSNTTPITDYLKIGAHDGTSAELDVVGGTTLNLKIAGTVSAHFDADGIGLADDVSLVLGTGSDAELLWSDGDADNHAVVLALGDSSQSLHITDLGARATDWAVAADTNPTVYIHSNTTPATDYLLIGGHDGTTAGIDVVGGTTLDLRIAGNDIVVLTATALTFVSTCFPVLPITDTDGTVEGSIWYDASEDKLKFKTAAGVETITSA